MAKSNEVIFWSVFSAGGVIAAFFMPITIVLVGIAVPLGWIKPESLHVLMTYSLVRVYLFLLISLTLFHWAHRFRFTAGDLGLKGFDGTLAVVCYGGAILGTVLAIIFLNQL